MFPTSGSRMVSPQLSLHASGWVYIYNRSDGRKALSEVIMTNQVHPSTHVTHRLPCLKYRMSSLMVVAHWAKSGTSCWKALYADPFPVHKFCSSIKYFSFFVNQIWFFGIAAWKVQDFPPKKTLRWPGSHPKSVCHYHPLIHLNEVFLQRYEVLITN